MSSCSKKTVYYTKSAAKAACKRTGVRYFYECPLCHLFHLSRQNPKLFERRIHAEKLWAEMPKETS